MPSPSERDSRLYLEDMLRFCERVMAYRGVLDMPALRADAMRFDAVLRNLELIGEAATHVPEVLRAVHPDIPWRLVVATRNRLIHGYLGIDDDTVWSIVRWMYRRSETGCRNCCAPGSAAVPHPSNCL